MNKSCLINFLKKKKKKERDPGFCFAFRVCVCVCVGAAYVKDFLDEWEHPDQFLNKNVIGTTGSEWV